MTTDADKAVKRLSLVATVSLVLMVAATGTYVMWPRVASVIGLKPATPPQAYSAGQQVDVPTAWYHDSDKTLLIFARASCTACEKAQPFLKSLVGRLNGRALAVMAHPAVSTKEDQAFAKSLGITEQHVVTVGGGLRVKATPTIVLVNKNGTVLEAWEGAPLDRQATIVKAIDAALR